MVTTPSYIPGLLALSHSMRKVRSQFPLLVLTDMPPDGAGLAILEAEMERNANIIIRRVDVFRPEGLKDAEIARFQYNWTKLRIFSFLEYDRLIFLDADMIQTRNMDHLFEVDLPEKWSWAACYDCKCNLTNDSSECVISQISKGAFDTPEPLDSPKKCTYGLGNSSKFANLSTLGLNSGVLVVKPDASLWESITSYLSSQENLEKLTTYRFAEQDFLHDFLGNEWIPIRWQYNAIKPLAYWHPDLWNEDQIFAIHYVIDKPWNARIASDGLAGQKGRDGPTHKKWWAIWEDYLAYSKDNHKLHDLLRSDHHNPPLIAPELDDAADQRQRQQNLEAGFPIPVNDKARMRN